MIFFQIDPKVKISRNLREKMKFDFIVPINFQRDFFKSGANFEFLAKTGLVQDLFFKLIYLYFEVSDISFGLQFGTKI